MKLYRGLPAGLQRQINFTSLRISLYDTIQGEKVSKEHSWEGQIDMSWAQLCPKKWLPTGQWSSQQIGQQTSVSEPTGQGRQVSW